jgi:predicted ATP-grasp superfamily ATP-dependent carboligase
MPAARLKLIIGASARAAAFSALRAGLSPMCIDRFGDADLRARCPTKTVSPDQYPIGFLQAASLAPPGPWIYTGGLENWPNLIRRLAQVRPLWGNGPDVLKAIRSPGIVADLLRRAGIAVPAVHLHPVDVPRHGSWLAKPVAGSGGSRISFWRHEGKKTIFSGETYYQQYIDGASGSAVFVGNGKATRFLGATRQLVGQDWLRAAPFHYCGSIGPLDLDSSAKTALKGMGDVLVQESGLRGLFGVDYVLKDGVPWPVEINPRYTASMEVLEYARRIPLFSLHCQVFEPGVKVQASPPGGGTDVVGKGILFTGCSLIFPDEGPWEETLKNPMPIGELPRFADIPQPGSRIAAGSPVLTFFVRGKSADECLELLKSQAADLDRRLPGK